LNEYDFANKLPDICFRFTVGLFPEGKCEKSADQSGKKNCKHREFKAKIIEKRDTRANNRKENKKKSRNLKCTSLHGFGLSSNHSIRVGIKTFGRFHSVFKIPRLVLGEYQHRGLEVFSQQIRIRDRYGTHAILPLFLRQQDRRE